MRGGQNPSPRQEKGKNQSQEKTLIRHPLCTENSDGPAQFCLPAWLLPATRAGEKNACNSPVDRRWVYQLLGSSHAWHSGSSSVLDRSARPDEGQLSIGCWPTGLNISFGAVCGFINRKPSAWLALRWVGYRGDTRFRVLKDGNWAQKKARAIHAEARSCSTPPKMVIPGTVFARCFCRVGTLATCIFPGLSRAWESSITWSMPSRANRTNDRNFVECTIVYKGHCEAGAH